jgi:hypothetical protein
LQLGGTPRNKSLDPSPSLFSRKQLQVFGYRLRHCIQTALVAIMITHLQLLNQHQSIMSSFTDQCQPSGGSVVQALETNNEPRGPDAF